MTTMRKALAKMPEEERRVRIRRAMALRKDGWSIETVERRLGHGWPSIQQQARLLNIKQ